MMNNHVDGTVVGGMEMANHIGVCLIALDEKLANGRCVAFKKKDL